MANTRSLIDQVRRKLPTRTDYALAKALHMPQGQLARVIAGKHGLGPKAVIRVAELLNRDVRDVLVLCEEDKATKPADIEFWGRRSPRISASVAVTAMALALAGSNLSPGNPSGGTVQTYSADCPVYTLCEAMVCPLNRNVRFGSRAVLRIPKMFMTMRELDCGDRPSSQRVKPAAAEHAFGILGSQNADFGSTLAAKKLRERHGTELAV